MTISTEQSKKIKVNNLSRLSLQTGYSVSHLSRVFAKKTVPSLCCLATLSEVLGVSMTILFDSINERKIYVGGKTGTI